MREIKFRAWDKTKKIMFVIFDNQAQDWYLPRWRENYEVMQSTGLTDKNGKEIFEGDIVTNNVPSARPMYVKWEDDSVGFGLFNKHGHRLCASIAWDGWEVIGNIYENPELLEAR